MIENLALPLQFPFMVNALVISALLSIPAALLSVFLVLKGWSLLGDAISHAVFPGILLAYIFGAPLILGAFLAGMVCAGLTGWIDENSRVKRDTVMGIVFSAMFGFGLVLHSQTVTDVHLDHILFGNMLGVSLQDIWVSGLIATGVTVGVVLFWRDLMLISFDEQQARAIGLRVSLMNFGLLAAVSITVVGALKAVGIILAIAFLIGPGAIAFLITRRLGSMLVCAVLVAVFSSLSGVYASFFIDSAPAPTIVLVMTLIFLLAFLNATLRTQRLAR